MRLFLIVSFCIMLIIAASAAHAQDYVPPQLVGQEEPPCCDEGERRRCGIDVGVCESGRAVCKEGEWVECVGSVGPIAEVDVCFNGIDDNCNGEVDENCFPWISLILVGIGILFIGIGLYYMQKEKGERIVSEGISKD